MDTNILKWVLIFLIIPILSFCQMPSTPNSPYTVRWYQVSQNPNSLGESMDSVISQYVFKNFVADRLNQYWESDHEGISYIDGNVGIGQVSNTTYSLNVYDLNGYPITIAGQGTITVLYDLQGIIARDWKNYIASEGYFLKENDQTKFSIMHDAGENSITIDGDGVGILTDNPQYPLTVNGDAFIDGGLFISTLNDGAYNDEILVRNGSEIKVITVDSIYKYNVDSTQWILNSNYLYPKNYGAFIGIGINTPQQLIHARDTANAYFKVTGIGSTAVAGYMFDNTDQTWSTRIRGDINDRYEIYDVTNNKTPFWITKSSNDGYFRYDLNIDSNIVAPNTKEQASASKFITMDAGGIYGYRDDVITENNGLLDDLTDGFGIVDFTYDGSSAQVISVDTLEIATQFYVNDTINDYQLISDTLRNNYDATYYYVDSMYSVITGMFDDIDTSKWRIVNDTLYPKKNYVRIPKLVNDKVYYLGGDGDINNSGTISSLDALYVTNYLSGSAFDTLKLMRMDVDGDGFITKTDGSIISGITAGNYINPLTDFIGFKKQVGSITSGLNTSKNFTVYNELNIDSVALQNKSKILTMIPDPNISGLWKVGYIPFDSISAQFPEVEWDTLAYYQLLTDTLRSGYDATYNYVDSLFSTGISLADSSKWDYNNDTIIPKKDYVSISYLNIDTIFGSIYDSLIVQLNTRFDSIVRAKHMLVNYLSYDSSVSLFPYMDTIAIRLNSNIMTDRWIGNGTDIWGSSFGGLTFDTYDNNMFNIPVFSNLLNYPSMDSDSLMFVKYIGSSHPLYEKTGYHLFFDDKSSLGFQSYTDTLRSNTDATYQYVDSLFALTVEPADSSKWIITQNGSKYTVSPKAGITYVGVGTTNATQELDVVGDIQASANFYGDNLYLPTTSSSEGQLLINSNRFLHAYGTDNTFVGTTAGNFTLSGGTQNVGVGMNADAGLTSGDYNVAVGYGAVGQTTSGSYNVGIGGWALDANRINSQNTAIGHTSQYYADNRSVTPLNTANTSVGYYSMRGTTTAGNNTGIQNTAIGALAMQYKQTGGYSVAVGYGALSSGNPYTANDNVAIGHTSGNKITSGADNVCIGFQSMFNTTAGRYNVAIGSNSSITNVEGSNNVSVGYNSLYYNGDNDGSTALGYKAIFNADSRLTNELVTYNTAIGYESMLGSGTPANNTGIQNTVVGANALDAFTSADKNVVIGVDAGTEITSGDANILIGYSAGSQLTTESNQLYIENTNSTTPLINGDFAADSVRINGELSIGTVDTEAEAYFMVIGTDDQVHKMDTTGWRNGTVDSSLFYYDIDTIKPKLNKYFRLPSGFRSSKILDNGTNVGIGITNPSQRIDIAGNMNFYPVPNPTQAQITDMDLTEVASAGTLEAGEYYYNVVFVDSDNKETGAYTQTDVPKITISANSGVLIEDIPISADNRVAKRLLYRSAKNGYYYQQYYIHTINDNTTTSYQDNGDALGTAHTYWKSNTTAGITYINNSKSIQLSEFNTSVGVSALASITDGGGNVALGQQVLYNLLGGSNNTGAGHSALFSVTSGLNNIGIGYATVMGNSTGSDNVAVGANALRNDYSYSYNANVGIGTNASYNLAAGNAFNTSIGTYAGCNSQGDGNFYVGYLTGYKSSPATGGSYSTMIGYMSGYLIGASSDNIGIGRQTFYSGITGNYNIGLGSWSAYKMTSGTGNILLGVNTGYELTSGSYNVFLGYCAGQNETGSNKLYIDNSSSATPLIKGDFSADSLLVNGLLKVRDSLFVMGMDTIRNEIGNEAVDLVFYNPITGELFHDSVSFAGDNLGNHIAETNLDMRRYAINNVDSLDMDGLLDVSAIMQRPVSAADTSGIFYKGTETNQFTRFLYDFDYDGIGDDVLGYNLFLGLGAGNITMGSSAGKNTDASNNIGIGYKSFVANTNGENNIAIGVQSLECNTTGDFNTAIGHAAMSDNITGYSNVAIGKSSLTAHTDGSYNTAVGSSSLILDTDGDWNTAIGSEALSDNLIGNRNTALGYNAGGYSLGDGNVFIGYGSGYNETKSNKFYLDNTNNDSTTSFLWGDFSKDSLKINADVTFDADVLYEDTFWDDLVSGGHTYERGSLSLPDYDTDSLALVWTDDDTITQTLFYNLQLPHKWKAGTSLYPHIHYAQTALGDTIEYFIIKYRWVDMGEKFPATFTRIQTTNQTVFDYVNGCVHQLASFPSISGSGHTESSSLDIKLYCYTNVGKIYMKDFDIHFEIDKPGSKNQFP